MSGGVNTFGGKKVRIKANPRVTDRGKVGGQRAIGATNSRDPASRPPPALLSQEEAGRHLPLLGPAHPGAKASTLSLRFVQESDLLQDALIWVK